MVSCDALILAASIWPAERLLMADMTFALMRSAAMSPAVTLEALRSGMFATSKVPLSAFMAPASTVPAVMFWPFMFVIVALLASIVPVVMWPPSMTVVVSSFTGVVHVTVPSTALRCFATNSTGYDEEYVGRLTDQASCTSPVSTTHVVFCATLPVPLALDMYTYCSSEAASDDSAMSSGAGVQSVALLPRSSFGFLTSIGDLEPDSLN